VRSANIALSMSSTERLTVASWKSGDHDERSLMEEGLENREENGGESPNGLLTKLRLERNLRLFRSHGVSSAGGGLKPPSDDPSASESSSADDQFRKSSSPSDTRLLIAFSSSEPALSAGYSAATQELGKRTVPGPTVWEAISIPASRKGGDRSLGETTSTDLCKTAQQTACSAQRTDRQVRQRLRRRYVTTNRYVRPYRAGERVRERSRL